MFRSRKETIGRSRRESAKLARLPHADISPLLQPEGFHPTLILRELPHATTVSRFAFADSRKRRQRDAIVHANENKDRQLQVLSKHRSPAVVEEELEQKGREAVGVIRRLSLLVQFFSQGLKTATPIEGIWPVSLVTSVKLCSSAVAARSPSITGNTIPLLRAIAVNRPQRSATSWSMARMRVSNRARKSLSSQASKAARRRD